MSGAVRVRALDVTVAVRGLGSREAVDLCRLWAAVDATPGEEPATTVQVTVSGSARTAVAETGDGTTWTGSGQAAATAAANAAINVSAVTRTGHLTLHAGVVAKGPALLAVPAASGTGKSTLVTALVARGWRYVSDEALVLRWRNGSVVPYPRPVSLSPWSWAAVGAAQHWTSLVAGGEHLFLPADGPPSPPETPAQVTAILLPERAQRPGLVPMRRIDVLSELVRRSFTVHRRPAAAHALLGEVVRAAEVGRLQVADPRRTAALVDGALG